MNTTVAYVARLKAEQVNSLLALALLPSASRCTVV